MSNKDLFSFLNLARERDAQHSQIKEPANDAGEQDRETQRRILELAHHISEAFRNACWQLYGDRLQIAAAKHTYMDSIISLAKTALKAGVPDSTLSRVQADFDRVEASLLDTAMYRDLLADVQLQVNEFDESPIGRQQSRGKLGYIIERNHLDTPDGGAFEFAAVMRPLHEQISKPEWHKLASSESLTAEQQAALEMHVMCSNSEKYEDQESFINRQRMLFILHSVRQDAGRNFPEGLSLDVIHRKAMDTVKHYIQWMQRFVLDNKLRYLSSVADMDQYNRQKAYNLLEEGEKVAERRRVMTEEIGKVLAGLSDMVGVTFSGTEGFIDGGLQTQTNTPTGEPALFAMLSEDERSSLLHTQDGYLQLPTQLMDRLLSVGSRLQGKNAPIPGENLTFSPPAKTESDYLTPKEIGPAQLRTAVRVLYSEGGEFTLNELLMNLPEPQLVVNVDDTTPNEHP